MTFNELADSFNLYNLFGIVPVVVIGIPLVIGIIGFLIGLVKILMGKNGS